MSHDENVPGEPPAEINPYEVLGVGEKASADEIKSAYRKKALKHHPGTTNSMNISRPGGIQR